jgi:hypothetical protein
MSEGIRRFWCGVAGFFLGLTFAGFVPPKPDRWGVGLLAAAIFLFGAFVYPWLRGRYRVRLERVPRIEREG